MTRGIWRNSERYRETYWSRFPNVWMHGDWARIDEDGHWFLLGRSDDTITISGKRIGPAEIEGILMSHPDVVEAAAVGIPETLKGEELWCFVVTHRGQDIAEELKNLVREKMGVPFTPARIHVVQELPKTRSAKILRRALRAKILGVDPGDLSNIDNPHALAINIQ